jgi:hypothetical protein
MLQAHEDVALLETEIEAVAERMEGCRKLFLVTKASIVFGIAALVLLAAGAFGFSPLWLVLGVTNVLGGSALLGSTRTTMQGLHGRLLELESKRAAIISGLELRILPTAEHSDDRQTEGAWAHNNSETTRG